MKELASSRNELFQVAQLLKEKGFVYQYYNDESYNGRTLNINDKDLVHFANCSYLGLETLPEMIEASVDAVRKYGTQNSMSRAMASCPLYKQLEDNLAKIYPGYQMVFPTTTLSHCANLPNLITKKDAIIIDAYVHNSVRMGSQLCMANGTFVLQCKHNDMEHIKYLIYRLKKEGYENIWYLADGIYSIHGNLCDTQGLKKLLDTEEDFYTYIDDAHGISWYGEKGQGYVLETMGLHEKLVLVGSFAKSMGANGGLVVVKDQTLAKKMQFTGQTMIFSGPIQPAVLGSLVKSTEIHLSDELVNYQIEINDRISYFRNMANELELPVVTKDHSPIQLLRIGDLQKTYETLGYLMQNGFFAMTATYPAIQKGDEGIRISITRHITKVDIKRFLFAIKEALEM